ncbi:MAG: hypothetical protein IPP46_17475 [Bacteroidetes bacterium]|nr:hypothetical protein [Bacteroidota bacterium]
MHYFPGKFFLLCLLATLASLPALAQNDLPGPVANNQLIKTVHISLLWTPTIKNIPAILI